MTGDDSDPGSNGDLDAAAGPPRTPPGPELDETTHVYRLDADESPCVGVVSAVAAVAGREPIAMEPLYDAVDPDALDRLVGGGAIDLARVTFEYLGYTVTVDPPGRVIVSH